jgi:hypothetical protein
MNLLSVGTNTKTNKSDSIGGYKTAILHLAPAELSGRNVCPWATEGCKKACLNTAGRGAFDSVQDARIRKTKLFFDDMPRFMALLVTDIEKFERQCKAKGLKPVVRLNGTSDITWEKIPAMGGRNIFDAFPDVQFYDYTKAPPERRKTPPNYRLVFSRAHEGQRDSLVEALKQGHNVAVVFQEVPKTYWGYDVIDGDAHDLRFLDPKGCIVGLKAKGLARYDLSGFVVRN